MQALFALVAIPAFIAACGAALVLNEWLALGGFYPL